MTVVNSARATVDSAAPAPATPADSPARATVDSAAGTPPDAAATSTTAACAALLRRDLTAAWRRRGEIAHPLLFFVIVAALFALGAGPDAAVLARVAGAVIWVGALLATLLALPRLFADDQRSGALEQLLLSPQPPTLLMLSKTLTHWLLSGAPLVVVAPVLAEMLNLPRHAWGALLASLLLGTPALSLLGAIGAALTLAARGGGVLLALLMLPLALPVLIFGAGAVNAAVAAGGAGGDLVAAALLWLGAILLLALAFAPLTIVAALRASLD